MSERPWQDLKTRGITLVAMRRFLEETFGNDETDKVLATLPVSAADEVRNARKGDWYPFETQRLLREAIVKKIDPADPLGVTFRLGRFTASWELSTFLKALFSFIPLRMILKQSASLWGKYYDKGKMEVREFDKGHASLTLSEFPSDPHFCPLTTSWMLVALETVGVKDPRSEHEVCVHKGGENCRFELYWES